MHTHLYKKEDWPFDFSDDTLAVTTKYVMNGDRPIVEVLHWDDGGWQFMCNSTNDSDDGMVICMGCIFEKFPWISRFKGLKSGYLSFYEIESGEWVIQEIE
ncbi:hypothetical protein [Shewanella decolorationis]|uniref:hypothetical protein n=1 Tax=Shewanella decolorationis TaxID=256839 RepID=UPI0010572A15|nr:hypothetical protein [Shewanella decolorationis]